MTVGIRIAAAAAALGFVAGGGTPALAQDEAPRPAATSPQTAKASSSVVAASSPRAGSRVPAAPPVVTLRMSAPVGSASARVTDGCGEEVPSSVAVVGRRVSVRLAVSHAAAGHLDHTNAGGPWRVAWHTVGADGRTADGNVPFTVGGETRCDQLPRLDAAGAGTAVRGGTGEASGATAGSTTSGDVRLVAAADASPVNPLSLRILETVAAAGLVLTMVRLAQRRRDRLATSAAAAGTAAEGTGTAKTGTAKTDAPKTGTAKTDAAKTGTAENGTAQTGRRGAKAAK